MLNNENKELCAKVLAKYGFNHQLLKLGEECTELAQVIFRVAQGETDLKNTCNLLEEFIDVYVVQEQLIQYLLQHSLEASSDEVLFLLDVHCCAPKEY